MTMTMLVGWLSQHSACDHLLHITDVPLPLKLVHSAYTCLSVGLSHVGAHTCLSVGVSHVGARVRVLTKACAGWALTSHCGCVVSITCGVAPTATCHLSSLKTLSQTFLDVLHSPVSATGL